MGLRHLTSARALHGRSLYSITISPRRFGSMSIIFSLSVSFRARRSHKTLTPFCGLGGTFFTLRAYLILVFGDIPAISMVMRMKGHNGASPCRMCEIRGLRAPDQPGTTLYVPLDRSSHPDVQTDHSHERVQKYDPYNLPL